MPQRQQNRRDGNRHKLENTEIHLVALQLAIDALGRLCKTETHTNIEKRNGCNERNNEPLAHDLEQRTLCLHHENAKQHDKQQETGGLEDETAKQDVVRGGGVLAVGLRDADQGGAEHLDDGGDDVAGDEDPEDGLGAQDRGVLAADDVDEDGEDGVDGGGEEDGGDDDEEVLDDEEVDAVGVDFGGHNAEGVADDFKEHADYHGAEVPCSVLKRLERVSDACDEEHGNGEHAQHKRGRVSVDNDGRIPRVA